MSLLNAEHPMSLRLRLALIFATGSLGTVLVVTGFLYWTFQHEINLRNRLLIEAKVQEVAAILVHRPGDTSALEEELLGEGPTNLQPQTWLRVLNGPNLALETPGMSKRLPVTWFAGQAKTKHGHRRYMLVELLAQSHRIQGALDITEDERMIFSYRRRLIYALLLGAGVCAAFGGWAAHRGLKPLRALAESTEGITAQRLRERLDPGQVPQELRDLVRALNAMLDRLDHAFERLSRFSADLAHELRTPITNLMGEAEVVLARERPAEEYRQVLESSLDEFRRLSRLISRTLFLARAEDPQACIKPVPLDAERLVGEVLAFFEAAAEEQGVRLTGTAQGTIRGDAEMLRQALANLVSNALEATPRGGEIELSIQATPQQARISVRDTGRGIPRQDIPHLLDRFYRTQDALDRKASGTGLGLAIVQSIARLHGGDVLIDSEPGEGTTASLRFPM